MVGDTCLLHLDIGVLGETLLENKMSMYAHSLTIIAILHDMRRLSMISNSVRNLIECLRRFLNLIGPWICHLRVWMCVANDIREELGCKLSVGSSLLIL